MRRGVPTPDYSELAVAAVGQQFALLSQASGMIELLTYNCMNLIGLGKGVVSVFPALSMEVAMSLCIAICVGLSAVPDRHFSYIALISAFAILAAEGTCFLGGLELSDWESWQIQDVSLKKSIRCGGPAKKLYTENQLGTRFPPKNTGVFHTLHISALRKNPSSSSPILYRSQAPLPLSFLRLEHIHYFHA